MSHGDVTGLSYEDLLVEFGGTDKSQHPERFETLDKELRSRAGLTTKRATHTTEEPMEWEFDNTETTYYDSDSSYGSDAGYEANYNTAPAASIKNKPASRSLLWWGYFALLCLVILYNISSLIIPYYYFEKFRYLRIEFILIPTLTIIVLVIAAYALFNFLRGKYARPSSKWTLFATAVALLYIFSIEPTNIFQVHRFGSPFFAPMIYGLWRYSFPPSAEKVEDSSKLKS